MRSIATSGIPNTLRRNLCAGNQGAELGPRDLGVRAPYRGRLGKAAVSTADDVLRADDPGEPLEPLGDKPRMLNRGRVVGDDTGDEDLAVRELRPLPHLPLPLVPRIRGLDGVRAGVHLQAEVDE